MPASTSHGTTVAFGTTTTFVPKPLGISVDGVEVNIVDSTHFGTTTYRAKLQGKLREPGTVTIRYQWEGNAPPVGVVETLTITFSNNGTLVGSGFTVGYSIDADTGDDGVQEAEMEFQFDGATGPTVTPPV